MNTLLQLFDAIKAGNELRNAEVWKNRQSATALVMAILAAGVSVAGVFGFRPEMDADLLQSVAAGVVAFFGLFNSYLSLATSKRVGVGEDLSNATGFGPTPGVDHQGSNGSGSNGADSGA